MPCTCLTKRLTALAARYAVEIPSDWVLETTHKAGYLAGSDAQALLPWRFERRFVELRNLVMEPTVENVVMCRFSCTTTPEQMSLPEILYREFDLCEFLTGRVIVGVYATIAKSSDGTPSPDGEPESQFANVLVRLDNGVVCSVEAGTTLQKGGEKSIIDRHELIGRRGVASDRVVDTHVPQESVYVFTDGKTHVYTDTDSELFGLNNDHVNLIRAAFDLAKSPQNKANVDAQHKRLMSFVDAAFESEKQKLYIDVQNRNDVCRAASDAKGGLA